MRKPFKLNIVCGVEPTDVMQISETEPSCLEFQINYDIPVALYREQVLHLISKLEQWAQGVEE